MAANPNCPSARVAYTDYPVEVDDLISDRRPGDVLSFAAAAGYALIASTRVERAFLFSIPAGSASDAVSISLPPQLSNPTSVPDDSPSLSLCMWLAEKSASSTAKSLGVALLSRDAVLRLYPRVPVDEVTSSENLPCLELRIDNALSLSVGGDAACSALHVTSLLPVASALLIFGTRGSAALVNFNDTDSQILPVYRDKDPSRTDRSPLRFGSMFYSAIRSIGAGIGGAGSDWNLGQGIYSIINSHLVGDSIILVKRGGDIEKWDKGGMHWLFNAFGPKTTQTIDNSITSSAVTSDGTLVLLSEYTSSQGLFRVLLCFDIRDNEAAPATYHVSIPVDEAPVHSQTTCAIVVCCDIVCLFNPEYGRLAWRSVARGVPTEGQVQGSLETAPLSELFYLADVSHGLFSSATSGVAACLHPEGVVLSCFEVPAPVSQDLISPTPGHISIDDSVSVLWRSFLQYHAGQTGAARASLQGLVNSFVSKGFDTSETLSQIVHRLSRDIICKEHRTFGEDRNSLLIDTGLERKIRLHRIFLKMLSDAQLFTQLRPDAPSIAEDRIWDAIDLSSRYSIMADDELLAAAIGIRQVENAESKRDVNGGFNEATSNPILTRGKVLEIARALRTSLACEDEELREGLNTVSMALTAVGKEIIARGEGTGVDITTELYKKPYEFSAFVLALEQCMVTTLGRLSYDHNVPQEVNLENRSKYLDEARSVVSLSCEAAIAILEYSMEARNEISSFMSRGRVGLEGVRKWLVEKKNCLASFMAIAKQSMAIGMKSSNKEKESIMGLSTLVVDKVLECARQGENEGGRSMRSRTTPDRLPSKRRRLDQSDINSEWGRLVRANMDLLREHELDDEAFRLAEKYGDFGTMMLLKYSSDDFNMFMDKSVASFGDDFAMYAFRWLEEQGHIELLLRGRAEVGQDGSERTALTEREPLKLLLGEYFNNERNGGSNLSWMHWLSVGDVRSGADALVNQLQQVAKPGNPNSIVSSQCLSSIAKLAFFATGELTDEEEKSFQYVSARLELTSLQELVYGGKTDLVDVKEVVRELVNQCSSESFTLATRVGMALEAAGFCQTVEGRSTSNESDYVWRRCVERQADMWMSLAKTMSNRSDVETRERIKEVALFQAAYTARLTEQEMKEMLDREFLKESEFEKCGCLNEVVDLVETTVSLAACLQEQLTDVSVEAGREMSM